MDHDEKLPKGWIRKASQSRRGQIYYFNKITGTSQWTKPSQEEQCTCSKMVKPRAFDNKVKTTITPTKNLHRISSKSKDVKKSNTPAQDRLKNLKGKLDKVAESIREVSAATLKNEKKQSDSESSSSYSANKKRKLSTAKEMASSLLALKQNPNMYKNELTKKKTSATTIVVATNPDADKKNKNGFDSLLALKRDPNLYKSKLVNDKTSKTVVATNCNKDDMNNDFIDSLLAVKSNTNLCENKWANKITLDAATASSSYADEKFKIQKDVFDEIPNVYKTSEDKTPAQIRLKKLQRSFHESNHNLSKSPQVPNDVIVAYPEGASNIDEDVEMDWEPCESDTYNLEMIENALCKETTATIFVVPDTNILIHSLVCIKNILEKGNQYCVFVPFVVLQELDGLKNRSNNDTLSRSAVTVNRFIYNELKQKNSQLQGQKAIEDNNHLISVRNADDQILNCCLQLKQRSVEVILASNDINLCNKAMMNGIETMDTQNCLAKF